MSWVERKDSYEVHYYDGYQILECSTFPDTRVYVRTVSIRTPRYGLIQSEFKFLRRNGTWSDSGEVFSTVEEAELALIRGLLTDFEGVELKEGTTDGEERDEHCPAAVPGQGR